MGNAMNLPEKIKALPDKLNKNEYIEITPNDGQKFYIFKRSFAGQIGANFRNSFSVENMGLGFLGKKFGLGNQLVHLNQGMNQQKTSNFYLALPDSSGNPDPKNLIRSSVNDRNLKGYINLFLIDPTVDKKYKDYLVNESTEFRVIKPGDKNEGKTSFGKTSFGKTSDVKLKKLRKHLKQVLKC